MSSVVESSGPPFITTIEWEMMDKSKFFPLSMLSSFTVRCLLYPLTLIKTRLQVQKHRDMYSGMFDAYGKIYRLEGFSGLYRGFWISSVQIVSGVFYISTYEGVRHLLGKRGEVDSKVRALVAGGAASVVGQTIIVPFDVISQHMMMMGPSTGGSSAKDRLTFNQFHIDTGPGRGRFYVTMEVARQIMQRDGAAGFYRGYWASLTSYVPNSALWWAFYHLYQEQLHQIAPIWVPQLALQSVSGVLGGFSTTIITNPLDVIRCRLQVQRLGSMRSTMSDLWAEEGIRMFSKGLSVRLIQSATFSFSIILGYETIKRISVNEEYKEMVRW